MAITASLGVGVIIFTNLALVPVLLSYVKHDEIYALKLKRRHRHMEPLWRSLAGLARPRPAGIIVAVALVLLVLGGWKARQVKIGDLHPGVPELHADSIYNIDTDVITHHFSIGVDVLTVIVETVPQACTEYERVDVIDQFEWHMPNVPGVQSVVGLPAARAKLAAPRGGTRAA